MQSRQAQVTVSQVEHTHTDSAKDAAPKSANRTATLHPPGNGGHTMNTHARQRNEGHEPAFTLIEMLVVLALIAILAGLLSPVLLRARAKSRTARCANNLRNIGAALVASITESSGAFPDVYYNFTGSQGKYNITLKTLATDDPDVFFNADIREALNCPNDDLPSLIPARTTHGKPVGVPVSYAYNVSLPLLFLNASRVSAAAETVAFYDGDIQTVIGPWEDTGAWAAATIRYRHHNTANFLFLDGHVTTRADLPQVGFAGGNRWVATARKPVPETPPDPPPSPDPDFPAFPSHCIATGTNVAMGANSRLYGTLGTAGWVTLDDGALVSGVSAGGSVSAGASAKIMGNVIAGGLFSLGNSGELQGHVDAGSNVALGASARVTGNVTTTGLIELDDSAALEGSAVCDNKFTAAKSVNVGGNVSADGKLSLGKSSTIQGDAQYTKTLKLASGAQILGTTEKVDPFAVFPQSPPPVPLPDGTDFSGSGDDIVLGANETISLDPGNYGRLKTGDNCKIYLSKGVYTFGSYVALGDANQLYLSCNGGKIVIYATGYFRAEDSLSTTVTGGSAADVYLETKSYFSFGDSCTWSGTIFAPSSYVRFGENCTARGAFFGAVHVTFGDGCVVTHMPLDTD